MNKIIKLIILFFILQSVGLSQSIRDSLFHSTDDTLRLALSLQAKILSPKNFSEAMDYYNEASELINDEISNYKSANAQLQMWTDIDSDLENKIKNLLKTSRGFLETSIKLSRIAHVVFEDALIAKNDAEKVDADSISPMLWDNAYQLLKNVAEELEDGDFDYAKEKSILIEKSFRSAELAAIKEKYLRAVKDSINSADEQDIVDYVPVTLTVAKQLIISAENTLNLNRYNTKFAKELAGRSMYEISHAFYLANFIKNEMDKDKTWENLILQFERDLEIIAKTLNLKIPFNRGTEYAANLIIQEISELKDNNIRLNDDNYDMIRKISSLNNIKDSLKSNVSSLQKELIPLNFWITNYETIKKIFLSENSDLIFDIDSIVIRLHNIAFNPNKLLSDTTIQKLLLKMKDALSLYPKNKIDIISYTDSYGNEDINKLLTQERADTIKQRLINSMDIDPNLIISIGQGESNPIDNNRTKDGRKKNRRIEIIIRNNR